MQRLYLVRHGETEWNRQQRMQGSLDSPLTPEGRRHAQLNGELLAREAIEHLFVSPLGRTRETADVILAGHSVPITIDARLVERRCGDWEGMTIDEIATQYPDEWTARARDPFHHRPPAGENVPDVVSRVAPFAMHVRTLSFRRLAIVSHGIAGRALLTHFLNLTPEEANQVRQPNDLVYRLSFVDGRVDCEHFRRGEGPHPGLFLRAPEQAA